jgi:hypothetical protein
MWYDAWNPEKFASKISSVIKQLFLPACMCILLIIARQRHRKHVPEAKNTSATRELLDAPFSMQSVSY